MAALTVGQSAAQDIDCVRGAPEPALDAAKVAGHRFVTAADSLPTPEAASGVLAFEAGHLPGGLRVEILHGGCAHYGLAWRFGLDDAAEAATLNDAATRYRRAAALMEDVAGVSRHGGTLEREVAERLRALAVRPDDSGPPYELEAGTGSFIDAEVEIEGGQRALVVWLDVVL